MKATHLYAYFIYLYRTTGSEELMSLIYIIFLRTCYYFYAVFHFAANSKLISFVQGLY